MTNGLVSGIIWDNSCVFCDIEMCNEYRVPGTKITDYHCQNDKSECIKDPSSCDPQIFVSWVGTDKQGEYMSSAGISSKQLSQH